MEKRGIFEMENDLLETVYSMESLLRLTSSLFDRCGKSKDQNVMDGIRLKDLLQEKIDELGGILGEISLWHEEGSMKEKATAGL